MTESEPILSGKTALITGSTSGIGLSIARGLASKGINIIINGFGNGDEIACIVSNIKSEYNVKCYYDPADVSDFKQVENMIKKGIDTFGAIDILVNNAGIQFVAKTEEFPIEKFDSIIAINLKSAFYTSHFALPSMYSKKWGRIINIASVHGLVGSAGKCGYVSAKHGIVGMTKVIGLETAGTGVTCNAICPGFVNTPLIAAQIKARGESFEEGAAKLLSEKHPSKQFVEMDDIVGLVSFLLSKSAAQITGTALSIDGGWAAQ